MQARRRVELTVIYLVAALLLAALSNLGYTAIAANNSVKYEDLYPDLFVKDTPEIDMPEQKTVYFTFDDGPSRNTEKILDILAEEKVKATFFVCAQGCDDVDQPEVLRRILAEGHEIGLHSFTHNYSTIYCSLDNYLQDLSAINDYIIEATGYHPSIVRFPGGSGSMHASPALMKKIKNELARRGYRYYDWDVVSGDQTSQVKPASYLSQQIVKGTRDRQRVIVLLHDSPKPKTSVDAVKLAIPKLREQGYAFDKLTATVDNSSCYG